MGVFELAPFQEGTRGVAAAVGAVDGLSVVGGGDSAAAVRQLGLDEASYGHISTGGGASLEYLEGRELPGLAVLGRLTGSGHGTQGPHARQREGRRPLIAGNWKMNLTHLEAIGLVQKLAFSSPSAVLDDAEVVVLPPFTALRSVQTLVTGDKLDVGYGAQDLSAHDSGAYTGEVSGAMLAALACQYVTVGHSERRALHGEDDAVVAAKAQAALRHGLVPIVCVGEGLDVRQAGGARRRTAPASSTRRSTGLTAEQVAGRS